MSPHVYSLEQFVADTRQSLKAQGVPAGVVEVRQHLERLLRNPTLLREQAGGGMPHDHGPCWVVYGQYTNHADMRLWERLDDGSRAGFAELKVGREVKLEAGHAVALLPGYIHSIAYPDRTFSSASLAVMVENRALRPRTA